MLSGQFSRTAIGAARHRAAHQAIEGGRIFADPLALRILGADAQQEIASAQDDPRKAGLRLFIAARSRFAEDLARAALMDGVRQIVILGAGLDTFAYRLEPMEGLVVFEVDHPATQAEKRRRLAVADIAEPDHCHYVGHDFEQGPFVPSLETAGFEAEAPSFFFWLGVTPYLDVDSIFAALAEVAELPGGAEIVFDYINPPDERQDARVHAAYEALAERVAAAGERFRGRLASGEVYARARALGFLRIDDLGPAKIAARYFPLASRFARGDVGAHFVRLAKSRARKTG